MESSPTPLPHATSPTPVLGLFEKRIEGDDCLLELARRRFQEAGLGAEMHAGSPGQLEQLLEYRPSETSPVVLHLPRDFNLTDAHSQGRILDFATQFAGRVRGLVLHDHPDLVTRPEAFLKSALEMETWLERIDRGPMLFIEYAAGLDPAVFAKFLDSIRHLTRVSACIDTGHVGIWQARQTYARAHPGQDVCALKSQPADLPRLMPDVETAVQSALPAVLHLIQILGSFGKPLHFHLHDGHPLSAFSPFGVSDHLSFLSEIPLPFEYRGRRSAPLLFGADGLRRIVDQATRSLGTQRLSFTLEIHPTFERLPLDDAAPLFVHWVNKTNAEEMNHWLSVLSRNSALLKAALEGAAGPG
jgi:hypothetical protein